MYFRQQQNDKNGLNPIERSKRQFNLKKFKEQSDNFLLNLPQKIYPLTLQRRNKLPKFRTQENSPVKDEYENLNYKVKFPEILLNDLILKTKKSEDSSKELFHAFNSKIIKKSFIHNNYIKSYNQDNQFLEDFNNRIKKKNYTEAIEDVKEKKTKKPKIVRNNITKMFFEDIQTKRKLLSEDRSRKSNKQLNDKMEYTFYGGKKFSNKTLVEGQVQDKNQFNRIVDLKLKKL